MATDMLDYQASRNSEVLLRSQPKSSVDILPQKYPMLPVRAQSLLSNHIPGESMATTESEENLVTVARGKWSQAGVPHRGWECVDIEDLGSPDRTCEMCESQVVRYVHHMEHPEYLEVLEVGCVCAGNMEEDVTAARTRETFMKSRSGKRKRWLTRKWRISKKGNPWIRADGYRVAVYPRGSGWAATISNENSSGVYHSRKNYEHQDKAKLAAFDQITRLLSISS